MTQLRPVFALLLFMVLAGPAAGARYHVSLDGVRVEGPSAPGDWTAGNCYADLTAAAAAATPADTLLLSREAHALDTPVLLGAYLGNRDLDDDPTGCVLELRAQGELIFAEAALVAVMAGLDLRGDGVLRAQSALVVINTSAQLAAVAIRGSRFTGFNGGRAGGGSCLHGASGQGVQLTITDCVFQGNKTRQRGGAIYLGDGFQAVIEDSEFRGNRTMSGSSGPYGGAIGVVSTLNPTHLTIRRCSFSDNASAQIGGAICLFDASLLMEDTEVVSSRSAHDGLVNWSAGAGVMVRRNEGAHTEPVELVVRRCHFADNVGNLAAGTGAGDGGAIMVRGSIDRMVDVTVEHTDFIENFNDQGGGLYVGRFTNGTVSYCRFHRNRTTHSGGATFKGGARPENLGETAVYTFCEFIDNTAGVDADGNPAAVWARGGAFSTRERPRAEFYHCTFVNNVVRGSDPYGDAIALHAEGSTFDDDLERCVMVNCAFWGDDGHDTQVRADADAFSLVSNCAWQTGQFVAAGVQPIGTVVLAAMPFISLIEPVPLLASPLVDAGFGLGLSPDLAGVSVPQGAGPDIGAYEAPQVLNSLPDLRSAAARLEGYPNPFNPSTLIVYDLPIAEMVSVEVLDLRGRRVAVLHRGWLAAGSHQWQWDGCDQHGDPVAGGLYVVQLVGRSCVATLKLMLVR